jgi:DNA-binding beta-propeller fold protein YncE
MLYLQDRFYYHSTRLTISPMVLVLVRPVFFLPLFLLLSALCTAYAQCVSTLAGSVGQLGSADGTGTSARFGGPSGVAVDATGHVYVVDADNHTIRKISPAGVVTTLAGMAGQTGTRPRPAAYFVGYFYRYG